jgi:Double zinc ribbon
MVSSVISPSCAHVNPEDSRFCEACGERLGPSCPSCGAEVSPAARYCRPCGAPVGAAELAAGRKIVTVLFADLAGSIAMPESLDPASARAVMALFYETMRRVIEDREGMPARYRELGGTG